MIAHVEREADPNHPGRTAIRITGQTSGQVQDAIDTLSRTVDAFDGNPGIARFIGPIRFDGTWGAWGELVVFQPEGEAC